MFKQIWIIIRLTISQVKEMGEIPGIIYVATGLLVSIVSGITIWVKNFEKPFLFYMTLVTGIVFIFWGIFKLITQKKAVEQEFQKRIQERGNTEIDLNEEIRQNKDGMYSRMSASQQNPQHASMHYSQQAFQNNQHYAQNPNDHLRRNSVPSHAGTEHGQLRNPVTHAHHQASQNRYVSNQSNIHASQHTRKANFCPNCGTPIHPNNKFCSSCGARLR